MAPPIIAGAPGAAGGMPLGAAPPMLGGMTPMLGAGAPPAPLLAAGVLVVGAVLVVGLLAVLGVVGAALEPAVADGVVVLVDVELCWPASSPPQAAAMTHSSAAQCTRGALPWGVRQTRRAKMPKLWGVRSRITHLRAHE